MIFKEYLYNGKNLNQLLTSIKKGKKPKSTQDKDLTDLLLKMLDVDISKRQNKKIKKILEIATKMLEYNKYKNEVVKELEKRRLAEQKLFLTK